MDRTRLPHSKAAPIEIGPQKPPRAKATTFSLLQHPEGWDTSATHIDRMPAEQARITNETFQNTSEGKTSYGRDLEEFLGHGIYEPIKGEAGRPLYQGYAEKLPHGATPGQTVRVTLIEMIHYGVTPFMGPGGNSIGAGTLEDFQDRLAADDRYEWELVIHEGVYRRPDILEMKHLKKSDSDYFKHCRLGGLAVVKRGQRIEPAAQYKAGSKIRRNDPCPCGSGIKSKKCCNG